MKMKKVCFSNRNIGQIYYVFVLISSLFYFFSSLRRGDQSTVFCIVCSYILASGNTPNINIVS